MDYNNKAASQGGNLKTTRGIGWRRLARTVMRHDGCTAEHESKDRSPLRQTFSGQGEAGLVSGERDLHGKRSLPDAAAFRPQRQVPTGWQSLRVIIHRTKVDSQHLDSVPCLRVNRFAETPPGTGTDECKAVTAQTLVWQVA